jgi:SAM-dependent methyltransferase
LSGRTGVSIVFAFERPLEALWKGAAGIRTVRADIEPSRGVDVIADIQALPFPGDCADLIWCHHVLEHVEDDRKGLSELHRVLKESTGTLVLSVPMVEGATTFEYGFADPAESGHRRRYGDDFVRRLSEAGLRCEKQKMLLSLPEMRRYGIRPDPFFVCTKTAA